MFVCYVSCNRNCVLRKIAGSEREQNVKFINNIVKRTVISVYEVELTSGNSVIFTILVVLNAQLPQITVNVITNAAYKPLKILSVTLF